MKQLKVLASLMSLANVKQLWQEINKTSFDNVLTEPLILIEPDIDHMIPHSQQRAGYHVMGFVDIDHLDTHKLVLLFRHDASMPAHELVQVVAHEMCHQYLAQVHGYRAMLRIGHSTEFVKLASNVAKYHNTKLLGSEYVKEA